MDPAQEFMQKVLRKQEPMNAVIDQFSSPVQQFYCGATVLVTGGTGFLGKQLIEKLFRSCKIKKLYLLARPKKGNTIKERLDLMLQEVVFDTLRKTQPDFATKIVPVEGDSAEIRLGISDNDWSTLADEVTIIIHMAATIRFDEPIRTATLTNVRGTREVITLAKECKNLKKLIHVSTAFAHSTARREDQEVLEQFYPVPVSPDVLISLAETVDSKRLDDITPELIHDWPNTYTFTKAIAEEAVRTMAADLPVCIVKPSVVLSALCEPEPGWMDMSCVFGPTGLFLLMGLGLLKVFRLDPEQRLNTVPVDYVNNGIIVAGWDSTTAGRDGSVPIYNLANDNSNMMWSTTDRIYHTESRRFATPKAIWYSTYTGIPNKYVYFVMSWLLHYMPGYLVDTITTLLKVDRKKVPSLVKVYEKIDKFAKIYEYFLNKMFLFKDHNTQAMINRMSAVDKAIFQCDIASIDYKEYLTTWGLGIRKFIIKDGLEGSLKGVKKQKYLRIAHYIYICLYMYLLWCMVCLFWKILSFPFQGRCS